MSSTPRSSSPRDRGNPAYRRERVAHPALFFRKRPRHRIAPETLLFRNNEFRLTPSSISYYVTCSFSRRAVPAGSNPAHPLSRPTSRDLMLVQIDHEAYARLWLATSVCLLLLAPIALSPQARAQE